MDVYLELTGTHLFWLLTIKATPTCSTWSFPPVDLSLGLSSYLDKYMIPLVVMGFGLHCYNVRGIKWKKGRPKQSRGVYLLTGTIGNGKTMLTFRSPETLRRPLASETVSDWIN